MPNKSRKWLITINNNGQEKFRDHETIKAILAKGGDFDAKGSSQKMADDIEQSKREGADP